jgi:hypothetical protein
MAALLLVETGWENHHHVYHANAGQPYAAPASFIVSPYEGVYFFGLQ